MAQDDKKSFVAYLSWFDALEEYSDAEVGQLMRALARYAKTGEEPEFSDRGMRGNWKFMCSDVKRASENGMKPARNAATPENAVWQSAGESLTA